MAFSTCHMSTASVPIKKIAPHLLSEYGRHLNLYCRLAGYRMPPPDSTPDSAYRLMTRCWEHESKDRPRFDEIHRELNRIRMEASS